MISKRRTAGWDNDRMADYLRDELNKVLDEYDARRRASEAHERKVKSDDERFLQRFAELRKSVVRPVFEAAGAVLQARGHGFSIDEQEFGTDASGQPTEAGITLNVVPVGTTVPARGDDHEHSFSLTTRHYNKSVWLNAGATRAGGVAGAKGAYELDAIDRPFVEEALVKFVSQLVAP
jgi:hypothetical protein